MQEEDNQKLITWVVGLIAALMVVYAPGVPPDIAHMLAFGIVTGVSGYVKQHYAEKEKLCPECAADKAAADKAAADKAKAEVKING